MVLVGCSLSASVAAADGASRALTLRPDAALRVFAAKVGRTVTRRTGAAVAVGDAPPGGIAEAIPRDHVALVRTAKGIAVTVVTRKGNTHRSEFAVKGLNDAAVRATALAIESLEEDPEADWTESTAGDARGSSYTYVDYAKAPKEMEAVAKPTIGLRFMAGYDAAENAAIIGPGINLGLCYKDQCAVLEAELPLLAETRRTNSGEKISYRAIKFGARIQLRPFHFGRVTPGFTMGFVSRMGSASTASGARRDVSDLGVRLTTELAARIYASLEFLVEGGADIQLDPAQDRSTGSGVTLGNQVSPWAVAGIRVRP